MSPYLSSWQQEKIQSLMIEAGQKAKQLASQEFEVFEKGFEDYVTNVDRLLDQMLASGFAALFPDDGVITEENTASRQVFDTKQSRLWLIDPIDGTEDFIHHRQNYAVMAGLLQDYQPVLGWIYAPTHQKFYWGGADWGLFRAIAAEPSEPLLPKMAELEPQRCTIILGDRDQRRFGQAIAEQIPTVQFYSLGSFGLKVMEVLQGRAGLYVYLNGRVKLWDTTGPIALARAAGLTCCDLTGAPLSFSPAQIEPKTLSHRQSIVIGWPDCVSALRPQLQQAVTRVLRAEAQAKL
ncbi:MAG: inositol monophosphatase family protein [Leptolyngbyaceae cyanobacterium SM1_1_3]|nr:inositol monophosphatase family protein [Leptolyngbyaceae cyanobacterium SM1_1_3]NJN03893.1 inositol monophosphatase family protein [Leptolyngbyaceae cyanobacterium RM1_1_2]NJO09002.1 inositol monophosphatase family protein [Leptolyngbyaceae cyanobacterium SL_1_1]